MSDAQQLALEEAALKTLVDAVTDRLKQVRAAMQEALDDSGVSRMDARLPDGTKVATISRTDPKPTAVVVDEAAFREWVRARTEGAEVITRLVAEVRPAYQTALLGQITAAGVPQVVDGDGVIHEVPGVEIRATRSRGHSVRPVDGGREAIAAAWRNGTLGADILPALGAGGEEQ